MSPQLPPHRGTIVRVYRNVTGKGSIKKNKHIAKIRKTHKPHVFNYNAFIHYFNMPDAQSWLIRAFRDICQDEMFVHVSNNAF